MSEIGDEEVENLGRALACQYGRRWASMAVEYRTILTLTAVANHG